MKRIQTGLGLIEALVALLILSLGLLATLRLQAWLRLNGDLARERGEAVHHAQQDLEPLRDLADLAAFDRLPAHHAHAEDGNTTAFRVERQLSDADGLRTGRATVRWAHRGGDEHQVQLVAGVARLSPVFSAALALPPQGQTFAMRQALPAGAGVLSPGRGVLRPLRGSPVVWIIDTLRGEIVSQCTAPASVATRRLRPDDLTRCEAFTAHLVQGHVRFSLGAAPNALAPNDTPLALVVRAGDTPCHSERVADGGERYIAYACAVAHDEQGTVLPQLVPQGWALGLSAEHYKVCRYTPSSRAAPLNFLVVRGDVACPGPLPLQTPHNGDPATTVQHQP